MENKIQEAWSGIHASEHLIRRTKAVLRKKTFDYGRDISRRKSFHRRIAACLTTLVLLCSAAGIWYLPSSVIGLDINPSLQIQVNRLDRVVGIEGLNPEGETLAGQFRLEGLPYDEAMQRILISDGLDPYLKDGSLISITVVSGNAAHTEQMLSRVVCRAYAIAEDNNVYYCQADPETARAAQRAGLSILRYQAWKILQMYDPTVLPTDVQHLTMAEIWEVIGFEKLDNPCGETS